MTRKMMERIEVEALCIVERNEKLADESRKRKFLSMVYPH